MFNLGTWTKSLNKINNMKHFNKDEFTCDGVNCFNKMNANLLKMLDDARELSNTPFKITSSWRSKEKNESLKNSSKNSSHLKGLAVDIACDNGTNRIKIITALIKVGFTRIGISKTFIHVDVDNSKNNSIWTY